MVERLIGLREVVVRPINDPLITSPGITGATGIGEWQGHLNPESERSGGRSKKEACLAMKSYILFIIGNSTYAISTQWVQQVEMVDKITPVPNTPAFVEGWFTCADMLFRS
jgi:hypothetical protein